MGLVDEGRRITESAIIADIGSVATTVGLIDVVDGRHRLVARGRAPTTTEPPHADAAVGLREALVQIEHLTGRRLLGDGGQLLTPERREGPGVDTAAMTCSSGGPLRLAISGLAADLSLRSARRVAQTTYSEVVTTLGAESQSGTSGHDHHVEDWVKRLSQSKPEAILMTGGMDGGPVAPLVDMAHNIALAASVIPEPAQPTVIFAGNETARQAVADVLSKELAFKVVDNIRPSWNVERLNQAADAVAQLYRERRIARLPGMGEIRAWSSSPILSTAEAFAWAICFLAEQESTAALGIDLGSANLCLGGLVNGTLLRRVDMKSGTRFGLDYLIARSGLPQIARWLPIPMAPAEMANHLANLSLRPLVQAQTEAQFWAEQAAVRETLRLAIAESGDLLGLSPQVGPWLMVDYLVISGTRLTHAPKPTQVALAVLDGVQPVGITHLMTDRFQLLAPLVSLAQTTPAAAAHVLTNDALASVGTIVAPAGQMRTGRTALRCDLTYPDSSAFRLEVPFGSLEVIPLDADQQLQIDIRPSGGLDLGLGRGKRVQTKVRGGSVGLIIDARGRPLRLPDDGYDEERRARLSEWRKNVGA